VWPFPQPHSLNMNHDRQFLFLVASTREPGVMGNTEWLARQAARALPAETRQTWQHLAHQPMPPFVDQRHSVGTYPHPQGAMQQLLEHTLDATDLVWVAPVYWYSFPSPLKTYLDHWSAWLRVPGLDFKARMSRKRLWLVTTSGDRTTAQPMIDSAALCAQFVAMPLAGVLWGKGGPPEAVYTDTQAVTEAQGFFLYGTQQPTGSTRDGAL
jgi:putative NADPH-quinone reductase